MYDAVRTIKFMFYIVLGLCTAPPIFLTTPNREPASEKHARETCDKTPHDQQQEKGKSGFENLARPQTCGVHSNDHETCSTKRQKDYQYQPAIKRECLPPSSWCGRVNA